MVIRSSHHGSDAKFDFWDFPKGLEYKGFELFDESKVDGDSDVYDDYTEMRTPLVNELIKSKLALIPNRTDPYIYPNTQEIQAAAYQ